jgi:hypothetical protein
MQLELIRWPVNDASTWLLKHRRDVTSQCGEDGIIEKIFEVIGEHGKICVELGAWDGVRFSNTHTLIRDRGWSGFLIESNAEKFRALEKTYRDVARATLIHRFIRFDRSHGTLDEVLAEHACPDEIDLLSIDIDGNDYHLWESLQKISAKLVVIEFNPTVPNDVVFVQERSVSVNQGCSILALTELAKKKGYELVCATDWNAMFVRLELFPLFKIDDNSVHAMYRPTMDGRIFHGYDGTIHVVGMPALMWLDVRLTHENFQVLPPHLRVYRDSQHR